MAKIILGVDPGIADTGYGVIREEKGQTVCITYGSIKTKSTDNLITRLEILHQELNRIIKKYKPELVAIEQLFFNKNVRTALIVGQARGVALLTLQQNKLVVLEFTPAQVKQAVTAYGKSPKIQVQKMVKLILKLPKLPQPDDAADALALALCAINSTILCLKN